MTTKTQHTEPRTISNTPRCPLRLMMMVMVMMTAWFTPATAQETDYSGTWYITNGNNYYLCPALGYYQSNYDTPYLTTYQTGPDNNSIWRVVKVEQDHATYYRFIHNATGMYLTANDPVEGVEACYLRLHLEAFSTPTDATLFILQKHSTNSKVAIRSKDYYDNINNKYWFDISSGNLDSYWSGSYKGALGFWRDLAEANNAAVWTLQSATSTCATPVITYNEASANFSISYPGDSHGVTIHYTTDGSAPTSSSSIYNNPIAESTVTRKLRAIATKSGYNYSDEAMVYGFAPHLFKTMDEPNRSYYMIPPVDDGDSQADRQYLTTSNVPNPRMQWLIKPASVNSGIQYYYLVNGETGKYVYFTGTALNQAKCFYVKSRDEAGAEADRFMFRIWEGDNNGTLFFFFSPKMISYAFPSFNKENLLCKQSATDNTNPTGVYRDNNTSGRARWQMVDVPSDPRTLSALPDNLVSDVSNSVYLKLRNAVQSNSNDYFVYPPAAPNGPATAATTGDNPEWYLVPVTNDDDQWCTYYYLRNAETGKYLYFNGTSFYGNNDNKFFISSEITVGNEDEYKFLVLKTANITYSDTYHIVPKSMRNNNNQANIALARNNATLRTIQSRNNAACWYLDVTDFKCSVPTFQYASGALSISCSTAGAAIYYAFGETEPQITEDNLYTGPITLEAGSSTVTAIAVRNADGSDKSDAATFTMEIVSSGDQITNMSGYYTLANGFTPSSAPIGTADTPFRGTIDGQLNTFSISHPLFAYVEDATIRNVILDNVSISAGISSGADEGMTGAITCVAKGATRIYNCGILATNSTVQTDDNGYTKITNNSSTVSGSKYVGGLVGRLDDESRVINCFSYANITGGANVGGIVGYNNVATTSSNLKTMVMNCMFYGDFDMDNTTNRAPIYNGQIITNRGDASGVSNFNYFWAGASYVQNQKISTYNCALAAETRFLQRFEFFRHLLNSNRELAAWWVTGSMDNVDQMMKWVLEPSQIGTATPYPVLKAPKDSNNNTIKYSSVVNIDADNAEENQPRNQGGKLGTLAVTIQMGSGGAQFAPPTGAAITTSSLTLNITDKDTAHYNFNYYKVQLPYYNDVGTKNYNGNRVVTGWKIVSITGGTPGTYSTGEDVTYTDGVLTATPYNFADRNCTKKDLYSVSGRVFNQGAYWDVPYGVTDITIEPYWAKAAYLADAYADVTYKQDMSQAYNVPNVGGGQRYINRNSYSIAGESQMVFTSKGDAIATSNSGLFQGATGSGDHTVYDYAVVLVGNYHFYGDLDADMSKPYTVTSVDLDGDNEPDYSYIMRFDSRKKVHPVRVDFIIIPGLGMAQKSTGGTGTYNFGIMQPKGWFESTNTSLFRETQFEYDNTDRIAAPYILQGGVMEQWVNGQSAGHANKTTYFHVGGNVWFKEFHRGTHQDQNYDANHTPVSVTGGDFDQFHLTGLYRADVTIRDDNAECYITGGRFGVVAGTGMDGIGHPTNHTNGNITWIIDNADIQEFYAGSFNADKPAQGNLHTIVNGGHIDLFCGGPKFGDMNSGKTVTTTATGCTFGTFFGAGYGGNSYSRQAPRNHSGILNFPHTDAQAGYHASWNAWLSEFYTQEYNSTYGGVSTQFSYQFIPESGNAKNVARIFVEYVKFSMATTHNVSSTLKHCTIENNFYGGGSLGKVDGSVTSVLDSCTVNGNVYGAGFSASLPTVEVDSIGFRTEPYYYDALGTYRTGIKGQTTTYTWEEKTGDSWVDNTNHILYTNENLKTLGTVTSNVTLTLTGNTTVGTIEGGSLMAGTGNVFGGGDESAVDGNTTVILEDEVEVLGNVYGGGNEGPVQGDSKVNIQDTP